ncbi:MAG: type II toxin-antitoxin system Phd/YefM family antitoxin [Anaerolineales bacterium]|nr:type II toxin-antitoxin system Phd/YefM family antitoxin [Anaerolineales bacterium]
MTVVNIHEAKTHLSQLLRRVVNGEEIIIARAGKPIAILSPVHLPPEPRIPGNDAGLVVLHPEFDEPLPEFEG